MSTIRPRIISMTILALLVGACSSVAAVVDPVAPRRCDDLYSERRCAAMTDRALERTSATREDVVAVLIVPDPPLADGQVQTLGGAAFITVRVELSDGTTHDSLMCGGVPDGPACYDEAPDWVKDVSLIGSGYSDVPCTSEPPEGCPTPIPSIDPAAADDAAPIRVSSADVPIDHTGRYEVRLGDGALPNGVLTEASFHLPDPWPVDVTFGEVGPTLQLRSVEPDGRPFMNTYEHGWRHGVERIEAFIVFDVRRFDAGAVLHVRNVVVR